MPSKSQSDTVVIIWTYPLISPETHTDTGHLRDIYSRFIIRYSIAHQQVYRQIILILKSENEIEIDFNLTL